MKRLVSAVFVLVLVLAALLALVGTAAAHPRCAVTSGTTQVIANGQTEDDPAWHGIQTARDHSPVIMPCPE
ncbi:MAG TPA: hypothetical protein VFA46_04990 [Actinomycetes bacterium]|nr:hypothetical protein [Actinomycetes bacterium]